MPKPLFSRIVFCTGSGSPDHRAVVVALAEGGADVVVAGPPGMPHEVLLNSISNEVWALGRRSTVVTYREGDAAAFAEAVQKGQAEMGRLDLIVRVDPVLSA
jgi:NAD(P)-dependent dehydrogenase (short-subunit alcohol dehydrogenase family)